MTNLNVGNGLNTERRENEYRRQNTPSQTTSRKHQSSNDAVLQKHPTKKPKLCASNPPQQRSCSPLATTPQSSHSRALVRPMSKRTVWGSQQGSGAGNSAQISAPKEFKLMGLGLYVYLAIQKHIWRESIPRQSEIVVVQPQSGMSATVRSIPTIV